MSSRGSRGKGGAAHHKKPEVVVTGGGGEMSNSKKKALARMLKEIYQLCDTIFQKCSVVNPGKSNITFDEFSDLFRHVELLRKLESQYGGMISKTCCEEDAASKEGAQDSGSSPSDLSAPAKRASKMEAFLKWAEENDIKMAEGVEIHDFGYPYGFGLLTTKDLEKDKIIVQVPRDCMLTVETADVSILGQLLKNDPMASKMDNIRLAMHVLEEKWTPKSKWGPYIEALPEDYSTTLQFTLEEYEYLRGSSAFDEAMKHFRHIVRQYAYFKKMFIKDPRFQILHSFPRFTFDEYRWAVATVTTRQNMIPNRESTMINVSALIPLYDFANHDSEGEASTEFSMEDDTCRCLAFKDFPAGSQVLIYYGRRTHSDRLVHNGYLDYEMLLDRSKRKDFSMKLSSSGSGQTVGDEYVYEIELPEILALPDPNRERKAAVMSLVRAGNRVQGTMGWMFHITGTPPHVDPGLLAYARINVVNEEFLDTYVTSHGDIQKLARYEPSEDPAWNKVTREALTFLCIRVTKALRAFPSSAEEVAAKYHNEFPNLSHHAKMALSLVVMEQTVLEVARKWMTDEIKSLGAL